jgi:predicted MFS family arabinose efflux permease
LTLAAFSYVTTESLPVGLLPLIAKDLGKTPSTIGLLVTAYGFTVVLAAFPLTALTRRIPRRYLLGGLLTVFVAGSVVSALAGNYPTLLAARIGTALSHAVFWSVVAATAVGLFAPEVKGKVTGFLYGGISLAPVIGVPAGTWLGAQAGWRATFLALSALGLVTLLGVVALVPTTPPEESHASSAAHPDTRRYGVLIVATGLVITAAFAAYTYISVFVVQVSGFSSGAVGALLLVFGIAGIGGTAATGFLVDRRPRLAMIAPVALLAATLYALYAFGSGKIAAVALLALWGFAMTCLPTALQTRVLEVAPGNADVGSSIYVATFNLGIAAGAYAGGLALRLADARGVTLTAAVLATAGLAVLLLEPVVAGRG